MGKKGLLFLTHLTFNKKSTFLLIRFNDIKTSIRQVITIVKLRQIEERKNVLIFGIALLKCIKIVLKCPLTEAKLSDALL